MNELERIAKTMRDIQSRLDTKWPNNISLEEAHRLVDAEARYAFAYLITNPSDSSYPFLSEIHSLYHDITHRYWEWRENQDEEGAAREE